MTQKQKIDYMRIACNIANFYMKEEHLDLLVSLYELTMKKKGKATISDVIDVTYVVAERHPESEFKPEVKEEVKEEGK